MGKVAIVGVEGSGKTVLMAALCECYKQGADTEPYLMPENKAAFMFMQKIPHKLRIERQWPEATNVDSLRMMRWTLRCGQEVFEEIEMLDYPGELYRIAFDDDKEKEIEAHRDELNEFLGHLTDAECLVVLLNMADLEDIGANSRNAETVWITRGIFDYAKKLPNIKRTLLAFTQADRYAAEISAAGGVHGLYASKLPMLKTLYPDLDVIEVSAVSGVDDQGRPASGYSTMGCMAVMRKILAERDDEAQRCLSLCDSISGKIKGFTSGSDHDFVNLLDRYCEAVKDLKEKAKPLMRFYETGVRVHTERWNEVYLPLRECVLGCAANMSDEGKATSAAWRKMAEVFEGSEDMVAAFLKHYKEGVRKKREAEIAEKKQDKAGLIAVFSVVGFMILLYLFCFIASRAK